MTIKHFALAQAIITLFVAVGLGIANRYEDLFSFLLGAGLITLNLLVLAMTWRKIIEKKQVAWPVTVIVLKYAILVVFVAKLAQQSWMNFLWFVAGLTTLVISAATVPILFGHKKGE